MSRELKPRTPLVQNASAVAAQLIREAIMDGRFPPGRRLKEEEIASDLGISRTPVREALTVLQMEGLVHATPNRGAVVRMHDPSELDEAYQLRSLLEAHAAGRAASRIGAVDIRALWDSCDRFQRLCDGNTANIRDLVDENLVFHATIIRSAQSPLLATTLRRITDTPLAYEVYVWYSPEQRRVALHYHRQVAKAIESGDGERAALVMKAHLLESRDHVLDHLLKSPVPT